jgi:hypothetical protein
MKPRSVSYTLLGVPPTKPTPLAAKQRAQAHPSCPRGFHQPSSRQSHERLPASALWGMCPCPLRIAHIQPCQASTFLDQPTTRYKLHQQQEAHQARGMILQCCHFTIIDLQQARLAEASSHLGDGKQIQRLISPFLRERLGGNRQPWRVQSDQSHFPLQRAWSRVLPVSPWSQPVLGHRPVTTDGRTIQVHTIRVQVVYL